MRNEFDCYTGWGFKENPFQPSPLHPDLRGERLLIGRDTELRQVKTRLHKNGKISCIEGDVGIGKTSLVNIAAFQCLKAYINNEAGQLLIPCTNAFQISSKEDVDQFCTKVFVQVAQTLINEAVKIKDVTFAIDNKASVNSWLNSPLISNVQVGLKAFVEVSRGTLVNTSAGFSSSGFERLVRDWLLEIFPAHGLGGVVCVIDNLELLETGPKARKILEALRDRLFNAEGLRWVFCGANGIVSSVVASPRLSGYLTRPVLQVESISPDKVSEVLEKRVQEFSFDPSKASLPITSEKLQELYWIINFNLRDLLAHADDYCTYIFEHGQNPQTDIDKNKRFETWLHKQTQDQYSDLSKRISKDAWELLDTAMSENLKGTFGPGDFNFFKINSYRAIEYKTFVSYMRKFEDLGIVARTVNASEEEENKRIIYTVTSKGALVHYARMIKNETRTMATQWTRRSSGLRG